MKTTMKAKGLINLVIIQPRTYLNQSLKQIKTSDFILFLFLHLICIFEPRKVDSIWLLFNK